MDEPENNFSLEKYHTSCYDCIFAVWRERGGGEYNSQTGCQLGRIETYEKQNVVVDAYNEQDDEHYIINGRLCNAKRTYDWKFLEDKKRYPGSEKLIEAVKAELLAQFTYVAIIDIVNDDLGEINDTFAALALQKIKPQEIILLNDGRLNNAALFLSIAKLVEVKELKVKWGAREIIEASASRTRKIELALQGVKCRFYGVFNSNEYVPLTLMEELYESVNEKLIEFALLTPQIHGNAEISLPILRQMFREAQEPGLSFEEKIVAFALESDRRDMVKPVEEVCSCLR